LPAAAATSGTVSPPEGYQRVGTWPGAEVDDRYVVEFSSLRRRAFLARGFMVATVGLAVVSALAEGLYLSVLNEPAPGQVVLDASQARIAFTDVATLAAYVLTALFFLAWLHRARWNLDSFGNHDVRHSPGWAIGAWFVPILGLWRPKQIVDDIWHGGAPSPDQRRVPVFVHWWWGLFLCSSVIDRISTRVADGTVAGEQRSTLYALLGSAVTVIDGLLALRLIAAITRNQHKRAAEDAPAPATATATP
jgi:hypothetical protein